MRERERKDRRNGEREGGGGRSFGVRATSNQPNDLQSQLAQKHVNTRSCLNLWVVGVICLCCVRVCVCLHMHMCASELLCVCETIPEIVSCSFPWWFVILVRPFLSSLSSSQRKPEIEVGKSTTKSAAVTVTCTFQTWPSQPSLRQCLPVFLPAGLPASHCCY